MRMLIGITVLGLGMVMSQGAQADDSTVCDELSNALGTFAGAATGYQLVAVYGGPSGWVAAGLYAVGAGLAAAGVKTGSEAVCEDLESLLEEIGESYISLACASSGSCPEVHRFANSLAFDFAVCPSCTMDEVLGAAFMVDDKRQDYLRELQRLRNPNLVGFGIVPRDDIGLVDASVSMSYFLGVQNGIQQRFFTEFNEEFL